MKIFPKLFLALACALTVCVAGACGQNELLQVDPDSANSMTLELMANSLKNKDLEESGGLLLKSKVRFQVDRIVYPPAGKGDSDPAVLKSALTAIFGSRIRSDLNGDPKTFLKVIKRVENWQPKFPAGYDPGWKFTRKLREREASEAINQIREKMLPALRKKATLLADDRYQEAISELEDIRKNANLRSKKLTATFKQRTA